MQKTSKTVRFKPEELKIIEEFLRQNPILDFSTVARLGISQFIENPVFKIRPLVTKQKENINEKKRGV